MDERRGSGQGLPEEGSPIIGRTYEPVSKELPIGVDGLRADALAEGYGFVERLVADWTSNKFRFDRPGEVLLAARVNAVLAGIGSLAIDSAIPGALRIQCFYVRAGFRRRGIGYQLAAALLARADVGELIVVNAVPASISFWEMIGFKSGPPDERTLYFDLKNTSSNSIQLRPQSRRKSRHSTDAHPSAPPRSSPLRSV